MTGDSALLSFMSCFGRQEDSVFLSSEWQCKEESDINSKIFGEF